MTELFSSDNYSMKNQVKLSCFLFELHNIYLL